MPFRIIPDRSERPEHDFQSSSAKGRDIFNDRVVGLRLGDDPAHFKPKAGALACKPGTGAGEADILARKAAANDVRKLDTVFDKSSESKLSNVTVHRNVRPMATQNPDGIVCKLAEGDGSESAGALESKAKAADPAEKVEYIKHHTVTKKVIADAANQ